jgi:hypothetical protein
MKEDVMNSTLNRREFLQLAGLASVVGIAGVVFASGLPAPGSVPKKAPIPWDAARPYNGIGFRTVQKSDGTPYALTEWPVTQV